MDKLLERFLNYVSLDTQSKAGVRQVPSTEGQWTLAHMLMEDIAALGVQDISIDEHAVVVPSADDEFLFLALARFLLPAEDFPEQGEALPGLEHLRKIPQLHLADGNSVE